ncbi:hypothetical protein [Actinophytocola gossypii]|uniref:LPXTG cell wall anchor domain-containing protein n=1 Tax=Actinophytocola gossypii TaxID=2812003 RepID=A0ABT2J5C8_9PSEU|nr:hypothetical protein [Actinophytocola gossypii]MCT2582993.1 hypothetical protein [Actinophytocola gossypii]
MRRTTTVARAVLTAAFASTALLGVAGVAAATPDRTPQAGDDRATVHEGNVVGKHCADLFPGSSDVTGLLRTEVDGSNTYLDVTGTDGVDVAGVIVKGGPAYNVYAPGDLGELPWLDLHSPLVPSGKPAQISHWFACGVESGETTTQPSTPDQEPPVDEEEPPAKGEEPSAPGDAEEPTVDDGKDGNDVEPVADEEELAATGFDGGWLIALGAALLLGGGALLLVLRTRGARQ